MRFFGCHKKTLEYVLKHEKRQRNEKNLSVLDGEIDQFSFRAHEAQKRSHDCFARQRQNNAKNYRCEENKGKQSIGPLSFAFAHGLCHKGGATPCPA